MYFVNQVQFELTVITLFCRGNILDGTRYPKICYTNTIPLQRIFSIEIILFGRWLLVIPSIDHGNSVPDTHIGGLLERVKALQ